MEQKDKNKIKAWLKERKDKAKEFCSTHPDVILTVFGGLASLAGGLLKIYANKTEFEDTAFTTIDGETYKLPCKKMKTVKKIDDVELYDE